MSHRIQANVGTPEPTSLSSEQQEERSQEIFKDVFEQVSQIVFTDTSQAVGDLLLNIETTQRNIGDTILLEALRQLASLQKDLASTVEKVSETLWNHSSKWVFRQAGEHRNETVVSALENMSQHINLLNNFVTDLTPSSNVSALVDCGVVLSILEDGIVADQASLEPGERSNLMKFILNIKRF